MRYVVFEAGSRAGLSAQLFFTHYRNVTGCNDSLTLVDANPLSVEVLRGDDEHCVNSELESRFFNDNLIESYEVFPADELTRQRYPLIANKWWNKIDKCFYDKRHVNEKLSSKGINVPRTFDVSDNVIVKPNSMSAGSKNLQFLENVCVSEKINIAHEYVVDCFVSSDEIEIHPREVSLKNGYDKYVKLLYNDHKVAEFVMSIIKSNAIEGMFSGPCHLQIAEDYDGKLFYIEGSKRISGTSLVCMLDGYNPFLNLNGVEEKPIISVEKECWFSFEQLLPKVWRCVYG